MIFSYKGKIPRIGKDVFIAPTATIVGDVEIDDGASIWYGTVVRGDSSYIRIGRNTNIQDNCTIHTDTGGPTLIGNDVTIGHNAVIHGCVIEDRCLIGIGSIILGKAIVRKETIVAAGSLVRRGREVGPHQLIAGSPAEFKRELSAADREMIETPVRKYLQFAREHRESNLHVDSRP
jgi:carbonic anhydrase/acetyltransferase-like protein (isoleucine patch superfamily)